MAILSRFLACRPILGEKCQFSATTTGNVGFRQQRRLAVRGKMTQERHNPCWRHNRRRHLQGVAVVPLKAWEWRGGGNCNKRTWAGENRMYYIPSLAKLFQGPEEDCAFFVDRFFKLVAVKFVTVNDGSIDFAPAVASWIFIFAVANAVFPRVLPRLLSTWAVAFARVLTPYLAFRYFWIPANRILFAWLQLYCKLTTDQMNQVWQTIP